MFPKLKEIFTLFLRLGATAFGGPAAHIAMLEDEVVKKRGWISDEHFLDLLGATNLIPGPNSTEMVMHCAHERAGWRGLIVGGVAFIFPAITMSILFAWLYQEWGQLPQVQPFIYGIKPAVVAIILSAVYRLGKKSVKSRELGILGVLTLIAALVGLNEILALFACGILGGLYHFFCQLASKKDTLHTLPPLMVLPLLDPEGSLKLFLSFLKIGGLLYGSGYVLFAYLDAELVQKGLLSQRELIDAIAVGQFTPGPVLSTAAFVGWQWQGFSGAILASIGIFLPSFLLVLILNPLIPRIRKSSTMSAFLDAVNVAAVAVILSVCVEIAQNSLQEWRSILLSVISIIAVFRFKKLNSAYVVLGGSLGGYLLTFI